VLGEGELVSDILLCGICFMIRLNMGLCVSMYVSFICNFCALRLCKSIPMYLTGGLFFSIWSISTVFSIVLHVLCKF
jgi:hypothetical protein